MTGKQKIKKEGFDRFVVLWNQQAGFFTPEIHVEIIDWLERAWEAGDRRLLLMAFRSSGKSTIAALFAAWLLYRQPDLRILVLAADFGLAKKMVRNVKRIIERHPLTGHMKPDNADQWASDRFTVKRGFTQRDPSMLAKGVTSNITGSRADLVICDDVEVPNTCDSAEKRELLRQRLCEIEYVLADGSSTQLYIGTPHTYFTIYADRPRTEIGESVWPRRYSRHEIARMKQHTGPNKFASQMMLEPVNILNGRLDASAVQFYDHALDYTKELNTLFLGAVKLASASAWWDPAFGSEKGDGSVFAVMFADEAGNAYLHHLEYIKNKNCHPVEKQEDSVVIDEATAQCRVVAAIAKKFMLPSMRLESNGIGKFLPRILRNEMIKAGALCAVQEFHNSRPKDERILEAFDAVLAARRLFVHRDVLNTPFMMEMREWRPRLRQGYGGQAGRSRAADDGLDAVAGALSRLPARVERLYGSGAHSWMRGGGIHKAKTDFEV